MSLDKDDEAKHVTVNNEANLEAIITRPNPMKVLIYIYKTSELHYIKEIADNLDMNEATVSCNLYKLCQANLIDIAENDVDKRLHYWTIVNKELVKRAIERYKSKIAFKLARRIPYTRTAEEKIRKDERFMSLCQELGLSVDEGIEAVKKCSKIALEQGYGTTYLWRKVQGYDPPAQEEIRKQINLSRAREALQ